MIFYFTICIRIDISYRKNLPEFDSFSNLIYGLSEFWYIIKIPEVLKTNAESCPLLCPYLLCPTSLDTVLQANWNTTELVIQDFDFHLRIKIVKRIQNHNKWKIRKIDQINKIKEDKRLKNVLYVDKREVNGSKNMGFGLLHTSKEISFDFHWIFFAETFIDDAMIKTEITNNL